MELVELIKGFSSICGDAPSRTPLIEHIIDVGEAPPIWHCFYWVSLEKRHVLDYKIQHMLDNGIGIEPSPSSWASLCLLMGSLMVATASVLIIVKTTR